MSKILENTKRRMLQNDSAVVHAKWLIFDDAPQQAWWHKQKKKAVTAGDSWKYKEYCSLCVACRKQHNDTWICKFTNKVHSKALSNLLLYLSY